MLVRGPAKPFGMPFPHERVIPGHGQGAGVPGTIGHKCNPYCAANIIWRQTESGPGVGHA